MNCSLWNFRHREKGTNTLQVTTKQDEGTGQQRKKGWCSMSPNSGPTPRPWHPCRKQPKPCRSTPQTPARWVVNFTLPRRPMELLVSLAKLELDKAVLREMRTGVRVIGGWWLGTLGRCSTRFGGVSPGVTWPGGWSWTRRFSSTSRPGLALVLGAGDLRQRRDPGDCNEEHRVGRGRVGGALPHQRHHGPARCPPALAAAAPKVWSVTLVPGVQCQEHHQSCGSSTQQL